MGTCKVIHEYNYLYCSVVVRIMYSTCMYFCFCVSTAELGNLVLHSPGDAWQTFHSVVFKIIQEMRWLPSADVVMTSSQLLLVLRLTTIPDLPG